MIESKFWAYVFLFMSAVWASMTVIYIHQGEIWMILLGVVNSVATGLISRREFRR